MIQFKFKEEKAINAILYVSNNLITKNVNPTINIVCSILYFADKKHISKFGRPILKDIYVFIKNKPTPFITFTIIMNVMYNKYSFCKFKEDHRKYFYVKEGNIVPLQKENLDFLSETDINCLDESIEINKSTSDFDNEIFIDYLDMLEDPNNKIMKDYITTISENEFLFDYQNIKR